MSANPSATHHTVIAEKKLRELKSELQTSSGKQEEAELQQHAEQLFSRAPVSFLKAYAVETLRKITLETYNVIERCKTSSPQLVIETKTFSQDSERHGMTAIYVAISDRPFVVDTLVKTLRSQHLPVRVLLHPIVKRGSEQAFSLCYCEVEEDSRLDEVKRVVETLKNAYEDLFYITDDFEAMLTATEKVGQSVKSLNQKAEDAASDSEEVSLLLKWLSAGGFVFIGYRNWSVETLGKNGSTAFEVTVEHDFDLGLFRSPISHAPEGLAETSQDATLCCELDALISFTRLRRESPVHRRARMYLVCVKERDEDGSIKRVHGFLGLLTSRALAQEAFAVPIIRRKLSNVVAKNGFSPNSHDYKAVVSIADTMPKSELFQVSSELLIRDILLVLGLQQKPSTRINYHSDALERFFYMVVVMPRERFSEEVQMRIGRLLEHRFATPRDATEHFVAMGDDRLVRVHYLIPLRGRVSLGPTESEELERTIAQVTFTWDDRFFERLTNAFGERRAYSLFRRYRDSLPEAYKAVTSPESACEDIEVLESLSDKGAVNVALRSNQSHSAAFDLRILKVGDDIPLSKLVPFLENCGLEIQHESVSSVVVPSGKRVVIYNFHVRTHSGRAIDITRAKERFIPGFSRIFGRSADNDRLNALLLEPGLALRDVAILRTVQRYLWQIKAFATMRSMYNAVTENPAIAESLVNYFHVRFDPSRFKAAHVDTQRETAMEDLEWKLGHQLKEVDDILHDRILRAFFNVIKSTVRTNFYRDPENLRIALKLDCSSINEMPKPRPAYEIFVSSPQFQGVHLRSGKVARGGLRWSERPEDFRTEVLGLMKTQVVKNAIIVPVGAKGGFVLKIEPTRENIQRCYQDFIRSLLELTDNRKSGVVIRPKLTICYDDDDPYLVVAADKGTATFSDIANEIATSEFDFWLGDAFASGGSFGYDHKVYGITARGAWEAVSQHFVEIGVNVQADEFTAVGIGDMSGDVFGNGLLRTESIKLIAAFNHKHIFIDPEPDPETSYQERERLFKLPRSQWSDYNSELISSGGGVFNRRDKEITLSKEAQRALGTSQEVVSGAELVKIVLRAPVDLMWNGGIGTYVKASTEKNLDVGDRANDDVRVDSRELRVKVVGEGGNLGFTQLARIEYAKLGGRINTDAVDNSGGVDLSDYEVNLKILFNGPLNRNELTYERRNELLVECAEQACAKVLSRNRSQAKLLSLGVRRSRKNIDYYRGLLAHLEREGALDAETEFLPDDETLSKRTQLRAGLTRPEAAVILSYVKISVKNTVLDSGLCDEPYLKRYLMTYFPKKIVEQFRGDVRSHPLAREIIATRVANILVERMGGSFVYRTAEEKGRSVEDIIAAYLAADSILGADDVIKRLKQLNTAENSGAHLRALLRLTSALDGMSRWILEHADRSLSLEKLVERYQNPFRSLIDDLGTCLTEIEFRRFEETKNRLQSSSVSEELSNLIASLAYGPGLLDTVEIALTTKQDTVSVAQLYSDLASDFQMSNLISQAQEIEPNDRWEALAIRAMSSQLRRSIARLTQSIIAEEGEASRIAMDNYFERRKENLQRFRQNVREFHNRSMTIPALIVISNQLVALSRRRMTS